jgi:hypothetical protein
LTRVSNANWTRTDQQLADGSMSFAARMQVSAAPNQWALAVAAIEAQRLQLALDARPEVVTAHAIEVLNDGALGDIWRKSCF